MGAGQGATFRAPVSEVDACNRAQAPAPQGATVTGLQVRPCSDGRGWGFTSQVPGSPAPGAQPIQMPILFDRVWS